MPPISPMKDGATGKTVKSATLTPLRTLELNEVYQLITANKRLITLTQAIREAALQGDDNNCRMLKQQTLPYVTPCGVFTRRRSDCLKLPSGLVVVDVDHLDSPDEAGRLKQLLFKDPYLAPVLVFISYRTRCKGFCTLSYRKRQHGGGALGHELRPLHV